MLGGDGKENSQKKSVGLKACYTRRFLAQHSVSTSLRHSFKWLQHCSNIATLCCAKNRRCESSSVASPQYSKKQLCTCNTLFLYISLPFFHDYNVKLFYTRFMEEMLYVFLFTFILLFYFILLTLP